MGAARIEHVNLNVRDPERSAALIERIFGWRVRWAGPGRAGGRTVHVGSADCYLALSTALDIPYGDEDFARGRPLNHVAIEVEDLDAVEARVLDAGFRSFSHGDYEPGRRFYFLDGDGIEFEVVSYA
jgi:catechol 2,3-dioxygenase-like lactoylglutathione lyase family enzyme